MTRAALLLAGAIALLPDAVLAQPVDTIELNNRQARLESPTNESQGGISKPAISVLGSADDAEVALTIGINPDKVIRNGGQSFGSIAFRAPLGDNGEGALLTQQGLPNKAGLDASYTWILGARASDVAGQTDPIEREYIKNCRDEIVLSQPYLAIAQDQRVAQEDVRSRQLTYLAMACQTTASIWRRDPELLYRYLDPSERRELTNALDRWQGATVTVINLAGGAAYQEFDYLDPVGFSELSENHTSFYASASVGFSFSATSPFLGFGYQYRRDYEDAAKRVICPPPTVPGTNIECKNAIFDMPERDIDHSAFGLIRIANLFGDARWGDAPIVELKAAYDFEDDIFSASLPVYFIMDEAGDFKGGIRLGWEERGNDRDKDEVRIAFFIVKSFDFMGL